MSDSRLPTEVELLYEVMPCAAMRTGQEPTRAPHACSYFRKWGTYHSFDYAVEGPPPGPGITHDVVYVGRAPLLPEVLSGCRKAPIVAVGINPNLPGWWSSRRGSLNPLFDDYKQYAHYFRFRAVSKLEIPREDYAQLGGGPGDHPLNDEGLELDVPPSNDGLRRVPAALQPQKMYEAYQDLLVGLGERMGWTDHQLSVGEDLSYGNMVACPSARWTTRPTHDPRLPVMTRDERRGIVSECFRERQYFLRQLFQSLSQVILIFSQSTANAFIGELQARFIEGDPEPGERLEDLMQRPIRLKYGDLQDGSELTARVIFAPHITGNPADYGPARDRVVSQLVEEAQAGHLELNPASGHLVRPVGGCVFCPMLEIADCDYVSELQPLSDVPELTADSPVRLFKDEKRAQDALRELVPLPPDPEQAWADTDAHTADPETM